MIIELSWIELNYYFWIYRGFPCAGVKCETINFYAEGLPNRSHNPKAEGPG
jgi:hypothetical protein